jgi:hypothetical protein
MFINCVEAVAVEYSPFFGIEKGAVLQEARVFNDPQLDARKCSQVSISYNNSVTSYMKIHLTVYLCPIILMGFAVCLIYVLEFCRSSPSYCIYLIREKHSQRYDSEQLNICMIFVLECSRLIYSLKAMCTDASHSVKY